MVDKQLTERIATWQAAGLIDRATAERLAAFEAAASPVDAERSPRPALASFFGPTVSVGEMLAYLGAVFVLAAWHVFANASDGFSEENYAWRAVQFAVPAVVLTLIGLFLRDGDDRRSRAAGVSLSAATAYGGITVWFAIQAIDRGIDRDLLSVLAALAAVIAAVAFRRIHQAVLTQLALLGALWTLAATAFAWLDEVIFRRSDDFAFNGIDSGAALVRVILTAAWWLAWAAGIGVLALVEARAATRLAGTGTAVEADRRIAASRFVAGIVAVSGTTLAVMQSNGFERVLPTVLGDLAILAVAGVLVVFAFRRGASAYLYPAAIGLITALTDLNANYVASTSGTASALFLEGLILLAAAFAADRLRRRLERPAVNIPPAPVPEVPEQPAQA